MDKDQVIREQAGEKNLNQYSNYYEVLTLAEILNMTYEDVMKQDDIFCTKVLLSNLEKSNFEKTFNELKFKNRKH